MGHTGRGDRVEDKIVGGATLAELMQPLGNSTHAGAAVPTTEVERLTTGSACLCAPQTVKAESDAEMRRICS